MKYAVTITPKPTTIVVDTISGPDVAEELARQKFRANLKQDYLHEADFSTTKVQALPVPEVVGIFQSQQEADRIVGFVGLGGYHKGEPSAVYSGPIYLKDGQKYVCAYIGQGEDIFIQVDNPQRVFNPRDASAFTPDPEAAWGVVRFPDKHRWWSDYLEIE